MERSLSTASLPLILTTSLQPWITAAETFGHGMGAEMAAVASDAAIRLRRRVIMMSVLDDALAQAQASSDALSVALDRKGRDSEQARSDALLALDVLIEHLKDARPNERAKALGQGW